MSGRYARAGVLLLAVLTCRGCAGGPGAGESDRTEPAPVRAGLPPGPGDYPGNFDVLHYDLELALTEAADTLVGNATLRVVRSAPGPLVLDFSGLTTREVRVGGAASGFRVLPGRLTVDPGGAVGDTVAVEIVYHGHPDDGLIMGSNVHGKATVFADNWPNRARFWFPSVDHPSDKATVSFTIHAPGEWEVIANGRMEGPASPTSPGALGGGTGKRTWRWSTDVPIPTYTMVVGAADFAVGSAGLAACGLAPGSPREDACLDVTWWVFPEDSLRAAGLFRRSPDMVDFFAGLVGPFPYEKLAHVQSSTRFGGMENASAIFYSEEGIARGRDIEGTVSHEIAHQWFGDSVTETEWPHLWLSEGFATYFGTLYFEEADGVDRFRELLEGRREAYVTSDVVDRPVIDPPVGDLFDLLNANNYPKGGWVLHMLRGVVGDETFFAGIRAFYARFRDANALTEDFQRVMEEAAGEELGWFFDQWLREPGYPVFEVAWGWDEGDSVAEVEVVQAQKPAWPTFRMPAVLEVVGPDGPHRFPVVIDERRERYRLPSGGRPREVRLDPDGWILKDVAYRAVP